MASRSAPGLCPSPALSPARAFCVTPDLGVAGGNHDDPGRGYDERHLLALANYYRWLLRKRK